MMGIIFALWLRIDAIFVVGFIKKNEHVSGFDGHVTEKSAADWSDVINFVNKTHMALFSLVNGVYFLNKSTWFGF